MKQVLLFCFLICFGLSSHAQTPLSLSFSEENFLPSNEVNALFQDSKRRIWMACKGQLVCYDGLRFKNYEISNRVAQELSDLNEDKEGRIWACDPEGNIYYVDNDSLSTLTGYRGDVSGGGMRIGIDPKGRLWIFYSNRILRYVLPKNLREGKLSEERIFKINNSKEFYFQDSLLYIVMQRTVETALYVFSQDEFEGSMLPGFEPSALRGWLRFLTDEDGKQLELFVAHSSELLGLRPLEKMKTRGLLPLSDFPKTIQKEGEAYWVGTEKGLYHYYYLNGSYHELGYYFPKYSISDILLDHEQNIWIATKNQGVLVLPNRNIQVYSQEDIQLKELRSIARWQKDSLFVSGEGGLRLYNTENNQFSPAFTERKGLKSIDFLVEEAEQQSLLYAEERAYRYSEGKHIALFDNPDFYKWRLIAPGVHMFCNSSGLYIYKEDARVIEEEKGYSFLQNPMFSALPAEKSTGQAHRLISTGSFCFHLNKKQESFLLGTTKGLYEIGKNNVKALRYENQDILASCILKDRERNAYWIGSYNQGLFWLRADGLIERLDYRQGLLSNHIHTLGFENDSILWISSDEGLQALNLYSLQLRNFDRNDGFYPRDIRKIVFFDDWLWMASQKGLFRMRTKSQGRNIEAPMVYLETARNNRTSIEIDVDSLYLRYGNCNLNLDFGAVSLRSRGNMRLRYRVLGLNPLWKIRELNQGPIEIFNLSAGYYGTSNYTLEVQAINEDGEYSYNTYRLHIRIYPPYWETWWFLFAIISIVSGVVLAIGYYQIKTIKQSNKLELEKERLEKELKASTLAAIKSQMNPHFLFNALNAIQNFIYKNDKQQANFFLGKFSTLMRNILQMSSLEEVSLEDEIKALENYLDLEKMRFGAKLNYSVYVHKDIETSELNIPPMIIQPFLENAMKHGFMHKESPCKLELRFFLDEPYLIVEIEDDGIGRKRAEEIKKREKIQHKSYSSKATTKRLDLLNSATHNSERILFNMTDKYDEQGESAGTLVRLSIPIPDYFDFD